MQFFKLQNVSIIHKCFVNLFVSGVKGYPKNDDQAAPLSWDRHRGSMQSIISSPGAEPTPTTPQELVATPSRLGDHGTRSKEASLSSPFHSEPPSEYQKFNNELTPSNRLKTFSPDRGVESLDRHWTHRQRHQSLPQLSTPTSPPPQQTPDSPLKSQTGNELMLPDRLSTSLPNQSMWLDRNWTPKQRQQSLP